MIENQKRNGSRPYYCSQADNDAEQQFLERLTDHLNREGDKVEPGVDNFEWEHNGASMNAPYDGEIYKNGILFALVEVKSRKGNDDRYDRWHMEESKIKRNRGAAKAAGVPLILGYKWDNGYFFADAATLDDSAPRMGGRWDRNDPKDVALMVSFSRNLFTKI